MDWKQIKGLLIDLDGVVYIDNKPIKGAVDTIKGLKNAGYRLCFVTNTSNTSVKHLYQRLTDMGLPVKKDEILSAAYVTSLYLQSKNYNRCYGVISDAVKEDFAEVNIIDGKNETSASSAENIDAVVIGDIDRGWTYNIINRLFNFVMNGADLVAMHKGKYWKTSEGLRMDIGAIVAGLEYTTGKKAAAVGKPEKTFFEMGLKRLGLRAEETAMIGDDVESDVGGAQNAGLYGILPKTGKYREDVLHASSVTPDAIIGSLAELQDKLL